VVDGRTRSEDAAWLDGYIASLETFRSHSKDVTVNQVLTFLYIAREPGITQKDTLEKLGLWSGGSSRIVSALSKYGDRYGNPGWDAIKIEENPDDRRFKLLKLTAKGRVILNNVRTHISNACLHMNGSVRTAKGHL
jgi:DNA-binding MarR family transcriptional regulator